MAYYVNDDNRGYERSRFETSVDENFLCSICLNVVKDARICRNNDHIFCCYCIEEHLRVNSPNCPECQEELTQATLRQARIINNFLSKLKINCNYVSRGCLEFINVEDLQRHVENCGFAPTFCSNEGCGLEINKRDKIYHEIEVCEKRKVGNCDERIDVAILQQSVKDLDSKVEKCLHKMQAHIEINKTLTEVHRKIDEKLTIQFAKIQKEIMESIKEMRDYQQNLASMAQNSDKVNDDKAQIVEEMNSAHQTSVTLTSPTQGIMTSPTAQNILVAGGHSSGGIGISSASVEIFSWEEEDWFKISLLNKFHAIPSSFIQKDQLFIIGGYDPCKKCPQTGRNCPSSKLNPGPYIVSVLNLNKLPMTWEELSVFPYQCMGHKNIVCQQQVLSIGGANFYIAGNHLENKISNKICKLQFNTSNKSCVVRELCFMPEPRESHGCEVFDDIVLIIGGKTVDDKLLDSVLAFDSQTNSCKEMPPLPHPLTQMATVKWRDQVVILGGVSTYPNKMLNTMRSVILYDSKTGKITKLPSMLNKRSSCCAVITEDIIVVMGGRSDHGTLHSVEYFKMGSSSAWNYFPSMNQLRQDFVAEVLPFRGMHVEK
ncbi:uncharacterized protein LOC124448438 [Xenia sp. Carnegie-2017]|uniref:uncharacterized protein LOC124448438 n=1 Tax=Xenia sp. Carnegie-2017 TaxID=2897299 RepID=UPI001F0419AD|nr:uncharacterized protein LOC124448438 [Xenia sp. Carnegie-2017]